jgi:hypothetical protein
MHQKHHHHHHPGHAEIAVAAYFLWEKEGKPLFNASLTFANWIDGKAQLECNHSHAPHGPGHGIE